MTDPTLDEIMERHRLLRKAYDTLAKLFSETKHERDAARAEIVRQDAEIERLTDERDSLMADSWRAYVISGGDPDGDLEWHCGPVEAGVALVDAVESLRTDYDAALNEKEPHADA